MLFEQNHVYVKVPRKIWDNVPNFREIFPKKSQTKRNCSSLHRVSSKISQVSRFPAKYSDSRKNFVFLSKQPFLELTHPHPPPPVFIVWREVFKSFRAISLLLPASNQNTVRFFFSTVSIDTRDKVFYMKWIYEIHSLVPSRPRRVLTWPQP